ncbi:MAG: tetratricopeptide repeat protein [Acetobacteraceae bacterium]
MTAETALACLQRGDAAGALDLLDRAAAGSPADPRLHAARGTVLLANNDPEAARTALRTAVALGETAPATLLNLALAEERTGDTGRARRLMNGVANTHPTWDEPWVRLAESHRAAGEHDAAETAYRHALDLNPKRPEALVALAGLLIARGEGIESRELLLRCCGIDPNRAEAWGALGLALMLTRDASLAHTALIEAQRLEPASLDYALQGVNAALAAGQADAEQARLEVSAAADPANPVIQTALGVLLERTGQRDAAIDALEAATALAPDAQAPAILLGGVLARSSRLREAEAALRRAAELDPDNPQIRNDRAAVLMRLHRHAEAHTLLTDHIAQFGEQVPTLCNLANASACLGWQDEAVEIARRAIALQPDAVLPRRALCNTLPYQDGVTGAQLLVALRECGDRLPRADMPAFANARDPDRRLTVGLLSGTLKTHPVGWLTIAGFETLDPDQFELVCLAQNEAPADAIARRFRAIARDWVTVDALTDEALALCAREAGIDILIDLGGYGDAARMIACAHRLAPVQVKWVGMQNHSSGLREMDWFITDRWETPDGFDPLYSERLLRLADGYACYSPPPYAPDVAPLPALANGFVTFGCFNNLAKITPTVIRTWADILARLPDARMVLKTHQFSHAPTRERVLAGFAAHGIQADRVELRGSSGHRAFMGEYNQIDIVLDPFPYSGGLTTCEALWMGVPTVTMPGEIFASRHSASHLSNAGLADWVVPDRDAYIARALAAAADLDALAALRTGLRAQVKASPLCDAPRFGRSLGAALRHAWRAWCAEG